MFTRTLFTLEIFNSQILIILKYSYNTVDSVQNLVTKNVALTYTSDCLILCYIGGPD